MLLLGDQNLAIKAELSKLVDRKTTDIIEVKLCDLGGTEYHIYCPGNEDGLVEISIRMPTVLELKRLGLERRLLDELSGAKLIQTKSNFDLTFSLPRDKLDEELYSKVSKLRLICLGFPLETAIDAQQEGKCTEPMTISFGDKDLLCIRGLADRVVVVLATYFKDPADLVIGKIFLQEFYDVRRLNNLHSAPSVLLSKEPPKEVQSALGTNPELTYLTLILFPNHYTGEVRRAKCIVNVLNMRDNFHYHIKACKASLQSRMRTKIGEFLKMYNRTKPFDQ